MMTKIEILNTKILFAATLVAAVTIPAVALARIDGDRSFEPRDPVIIAAPGFYNPNSPAATGGGSFGYNARIEVN
jgi:hypothetical protein